jgi:myo-inositol catabolism protein IolH
MKIAFDVDVLAKQMSITKMVHQVADWGYKYIEQSPHPRINPFYKHPKASRETLAEYKSALKETGVEISSFIVVYNWSGPGEERRKAAVTNWKRMIEIAVGMGVPVINTELSGDPDQPVLCEEMWYRSMEELLPIIERENIRIEVQSHPYDFCENNNETCDLVKSLYSDNVKYLYSAPHTFFYDNGKGDVRKMLDYAGEDLSHVLVADTMNHTTDCRYIVNPPGTKAVVHQHLGVGEGEVDFSGIFEKLRQMDFAKRTFKVGGDSIIAAALFGYPEKIAKQATETRERIAKELLG